MAAGRVSGGFGVILFCSHFPYSLSTLAALPQGIKENIQQDQEVRTRSPVEGFLLHKGQCVGVKDIQRGSRLRQVILPAVRGGRLDPSQGVKPFDIDGVPFDDLLSRERRKQRSSGGLDDLKEEVRKPEGCPPRSLIKLAEKFLDKTENRWLLACEALGLHNGRLVVVPSDPLPGFINDRLIDFRHKR